MDNARAIKSPVYRWTEDVTSTSACPDDDESVTAVSPSSTSSSGPTTTATTPDVSVSTMPTDASVGRPTTRTTRGPKRILEEDPTVAVVGTGRSASYVGDTTVSGDPSTGEICCRCSAASSTTAQEPTGSPSHGCTSSARVSSASTSVCPSVRSVRKRQRSQRSSGQAGDRRSRSRATCRGPGCRSRGLIGPRASRMSPRAVVRGLLMRTHHLPTALASSRPRASGPVGYVRPCRQRRSLAVPARVEQNDG